MTEDIPPKTAENCAPEATKKSPIAPDPRLLST
jgi:hypothetical protein